MLLIAAPFFSTKTIQASETEHVSAQDMQESLSNMSENQLQELQKIMAQALDSLVTKLIEQTSQIEGVLEDLSMSLPNDAFKLKNKNELIKQIKKTRQIIAQIKNEKFVQVDPQTLQFLIAFNQVLMEHISEALQNGLKEIPSFQEKLVIIHKKAPTINIEQVETEIFKNEEQLFDLQKKASEFGTNWFNRQFRRLNNFITIAHRKKLDKNIFLGTFITTILLHLIQEKTSLFYKPSEVLEWKYMEQSHLADNAKNIAAYNDRYKDMLDEMKKEIDMLKSQENGSTHIFRRIFGYPLARHTDGTFFGGETAINWNNEKVNWFGNTPWLVKTTAASLAASYLPAIELCYGKDWWVKLSSWGANKLQILHAKLVGGVAGKQAEQAAKKGEMESWEPQYTFDDVVGFDHIKNALNRILEYIKDPERFDRANIPPEKGYLFTGLPGTGKSFVAEAFGGEIRKTFKEIGRSEDELGFYNIPATVILSEGVDWLLSVAKRESPCVIFIDEIDLLRLQRGSKGNNTLLSDCLNAMSGVMSKDDGKQVILIAATNKPEHLDRALRRRGRFGKIIYFELPTLAERKIYFTNKLKPLLPDLSIIDIDSLAKETEDCSYEELSAMMNSAFQDSKRSGVPITQKDLEKALDEEIRNIINKNLHVSDQEQKLMAVHQAGHALALELLKTRRELAAVTIKPITAKLQDEELKHFKKRKQKDVVYGQVFTRCSFDHLGELSQEETLKECKILLAGIAAEKILLGSCGYSYHAQDKQEALDLIKPIVFQGLNMKKMPNELQVKYFEKAIGTLENCQQEIENLLKKHEAKLKEIAQELQEKKTLTARKVKEILGEKNNGTLLEGSISSEICPA